MKPGGGKQKGANFERATGKGLSNWLTCGERGDLFTRNVLSGGKFTNAEQRGKKEGIPGDLMAAHPLAYEFLTHFLVECKHYADLGLDTFFYDRRRKSFLWTVLTHTKKQARSAELHWLIIAKQNLKQPLVFMSVGLAKVAVKHMTDCRGLRLHTLHNGATAVMDLDSFWKIDPVTFMKELENG